MSSAQSSSRVTVVARLASDVRALQHQLERASASGLSSVSSPRRTTHSQLTRRLSKLWSLIAESASNRSAGDPARAERLAPAALQEQVQWATTYVEDHCQAMRDEGAQHEEDEFDFRGTDAMMDETPHSAQGSSAAASQATQAMRDIDTQLAGGEEDQSSRQDDSMSPGERDPDACTRPHPARSVPRVITATSSSSSPPVDLSLPLDLPPLPSLDRISAPVDASGQRIRVVYFTILHSHRSADCRSQLHYIDRVGDVADRLGVASLGTLYQNEATKREMGLRFSNSEDTYSMPECSADTIYLKYGVRDRHGQMMFDVRTMRIERLADLADQVHEYQAWRATKPAGPNSLIQYLEAHPHSSFAEDQAILRETLLLLQSSAVCVVPSATLLEPRHSVREWLRRVREVERETGCTVFPPIEVEECMAHKDNYLARIMDAACDGGEHPGETHVTRPSRVKQERQSESSPLQPAAAAVAPAPVASDTAVSRRSCRESWRGRVEYVHRPHNGLVPPTILLPSAAQILALTPAEQQEFIRHLRSILISEVSSGGWRTSSTPTWVVKGTIKQPSHLLGVRVTDEDILRMMHDCGEDCGEGYYAPQPGFILQPFLRGFEWELHLYFMRGELILQLVDVIGGQPWMKPEWSLVRPQCLEFCRRILRICERECHLVTRTPIVRIDVGAEFQSCTRGERDLPEEQLRSEQPRPSEWRCTGNGYIVRLMLKKVSSSLDINYYSTCTSYPILMVAARALAQHLLRIIDERRSDGHR